MNFDYQNEEEIKIQVIVPWLKKMGYKQSCMEFEKTIPVQEGKKKKSIFADIVIYADKKKETPLIVIDTKSPKVILSRTDREQVISYARLLPKIAPLAVLTNGQTTQVYQTLDKVRIKELPKRSEILKNFVTVVIGTQIQKVLREEATKELFTIDDVGTFKGLLKRCHNIIRNNEGYDPIQAFDEMSKVLFAKMYEEQYHKNSNRFVLKTFDETLKKLNVNIVQQQFQEIQKIDKYKNLFPQDTSIQLQDRTIRSFVKIFEKFDLTLTNFDVKGEAFEYFLSDTFTGGLGEYFTPRNVVEFMVEAFLPKIGEKIVDPFCGTGGFLIYAFDLISEKIRLQDFSDEEKKKWRYQLSCESLYGTDWKDRTAQACKMNMIVHGDGNTGIYQHNGLLNIPGVIEDNKFDLCFTNPPFGAIETDEDVLNLYDLGSGRTSQKREVLAIERCMKLVKPGSGRIAIVLPDGIINNDSFSYVRKYIAKHTEIIAIVGLNKETFEGYNATAKTSILFLKRRQSSIENLPQNIFMAVCLNSGYAPNGQQVPGNQLPDILFDLKNIHKTDFEPLFPHDKIITISNPSQRFDAERYIVILDREGIEQPLILSANLYDDIERIMQLSATVKQKLQKIYEREIFEHILLSKLLTPVSDKIYLEPDTEYMCLGVRGKADGVFIRGMKFGKEIKAPSLNRVVDGWLVYSRLFAHNGSFAYITEQFEGGVFSNEFPTFKIKDDIVYGKNDLLEYLIFYLASPQVTNYIRRLTTGSTKQSRGRFKEHQFLALKIPIPKDKSIFVNIVNSIKLIRRFQTEIIALSEKIKQLPISFQIAFPNIQE